MDQFRIRLAKETFKFSASHFTLFSSTEAERLHGHNYQVRIETDLQNLDAHGMGFEFNTLKPVIKAATDLWDERVLIPTESPFLKISEETIRGESHWVVDFHNRSYRLPKSDVVMLKTTNVTSEELARLIAIEIVRGWKKSAAADLAKRVLSITVTVEETRGQGASFTVSSPLTRSEFT